MSYLVGDIARLLRRAFDERVRELGVTSTQARLLLILDRHPNENQAFYAERLDVEPMTLCRMVDRMEESGLVERKPDPNDRRARLVSLTPRSHSELARIRSTLTELNTQMLDGFTLEDQSQLRKLIGNLATNLGQLCDRPEGLRAHG
ncbi:MAG: MarR family transcriptional regulator [Caenibius sp.]